MRIAAIIFLIFFPMLTFAQFLPKGQYLEGGFHIGRILKHTPKIVIPLNEIPVTMGGELTWEMRCYGKKYWHGLSRFPRMGFISNYFTFRDSRLGWGLGIMPYVSTRFFKLGPVEMFGRMGMGIGYVSEKWDGYFNPDNNLIGSHFNSNVAFRIGFGIEAHKNFEIRPSFSFSHFSNGSSQYPNMGINIMTFHLGILFKNNPVLLEDFVKDHPDKPERHKGIRISAFGGLGLKEKGRTYRGPKFPITVLSVDAGLFVSRINVLKLGITHEFHHEEYEFHLHSTGELTHDVATRKANKFLFYVEDEILLGKIGLIGQIGYYFNNATEKFPFTRIGFRYYPLDPIKNSIVPYIALRLKSHGITAEYFDLTIGVAIK
jgi:hypothetical protein